jgi:hypothetical protein
VGALAKAKLASKIVFEGTAWAGVSRLIYPLLLLRLLRLVRSGPLLPIARGSHDSDPTRRRFLYGTLREADTRVNRRCSTYITRQTYSVLNGIGLCLNIRICFRAFCQYWRRISLRRVDLSLGNSATRSHQDELASRMSAFDERMSVPQAIGIYPTKALERHSLPHSAVRQ